MNAPHHSALPSLAVFEDEHDAIQHFLHHFPPEDIHGMIYRLFTEFLLTETFAGMTSDQRAHLLLFYEQLPVFAQASLQLQLQRIRQGATEHYMITPPQPLENECTKPGSARKRAKAPGSKKHRRQSNK